MNEKEKRLADLLRPGLAFGEFTDFKKHQLNRAAAPSPYKLQYRTPDHPTTPGLLTAEAVSVIGFTFYEMAYQLNLNYDRFAGIPHAGDPFAEEFYKASGESIPRLLFEKSGTGLERQVLGLKPGETYNEGDIVLILDDVITLGQSKVEAISPLLNLGLKVNDILILVDREEGGAEVIKEAGYNLHSVFKISTLLKYYLETEQIQEKQYQNVVKYVRNFQE